MAFSDFPSRQDSIAVLYLARKAEGIDAFRSFIQSYITYPAGIEHDLVVIFKGYEGEEDLKSARAEFALLTYISIELPDEGFDLGSYLETAKNLTHEYICCFNTFSKILSTDWLKKFYSHIVQPNVGIVGATGSYEGMQTSITLIQKVIWLSSQLTIDEKERARLEKYFSFIFSPSSDPIKKKNSVLSACKQQIKSAIKNTLLWQKPCNLEQQYEKWWEKTQKIGDIAALCTLPPFPNPHIRSNAFMTKRNRFLTFVRKPFITKINACHFESGPEGMTQQVLRAGLHARIVGKNGTGYDVENWSSSATFRLDDQSNLLIADNQTLFFTRADEDTRLIHTWTSWGEESLLFPKDFPILGIKIKREF